MLACAYITATIDVIVVWAAECHAEFMLVCDINCQEMTVHVQSINHATTILLQIWQVPALLMSYWPNVALPPLALRPVQAAVSLLSDKQTAFAAVGVKEGRHCICLPC